MTFGEGSANVKRGGESADEFHRSHFIPEELSKLIELEGDTGLNVLAKLTNGFVIYHKNRATCGYRIIEEVHSLIASVPMKSAEVLEP